MQTSNATRIGVESKLRLVQDRAHMSHIAVFRSPLSSTCGVLFPALSDQQRHHVCEDPRPLGHALQVRRADEHTNALQVRRRSEEDTFIETKANKADLI